MSATAAPELFACGQRIYRRVKDRKKLVAILREFQMFDLKDGRTLLELSITLAQVALNSPTVDEEYKSYLKWHWECITELLSQVDHLIDRMIRNSSWIKTWGRHKARDELRDLGGTGVVSQAVREFQWIVMAVREVEKEDSPLFLSYNKFQLVESENRVYNSNRNAFFGNGRLTNPMNGIPNNRQWFLFETMSYQRQDPQSREETKQNAHILAQRLDKAKKHGGILRLVGFRDDSQGSSFQLIFACPFRGHYPDSLAKYLRINPTKPSLKFRVNLCSQLATAVLQTMTLRLVHKNIRPENILLLPKETTIGAMGGNTPGVFLTGWQYARNVDPSVTVYRGETELRRKIYQHPERQKVVAERMYCMAHDVYSLGVCMIEILTWESLLRAVEPPTMSKRFIAAFKSLRLKVDPSEPYTKDAGQIKQTLVAMCDRDITVVAGEKMTVLIKEFLTCLDRKSGLKRSVEYQTADDDGARRELAVHFVQKTLNTLQSIQNSI